MIVIFAEFGFYVQVVHATGLIILCQLNIIKIGTLLLNIMYDNQIINNLNLVDILCNLDAHAVFESHGGVQFVDEDFASQRRQMEHHRLVVEAADEELVFALLVVEAAWELALLGAADFFGGGLLLVVFSRLHEHFEVFVEDAWSDLDVGEGLGCAFEVVH